MPVKRAMTIKELACQVLSGELDFGLSDDKKFLEELQSIPGIGPWTAQYIALRARGSADVFLAGDRVTRKACLELLCTDKGKEILDYADAWRSWRGYAGMHLWRYVSSLK